MTNVEARMTNKTRMTKLEQPHSTLDGGTGFVIRASTLLRHLSFVIRHLPSYPDVRRAISTREADFMSPRWPIRLFAEIDEEAVIELQPALGRVAVELQQVRPLLCHIGIELVVPLAVERVGDVEPAAVEAQLQHL